MAFYIGGGIGHTLIGQRPIGGGRYNTGVIATINQTAPSFTSSVAGTVGQKTVLATAILNAPPFSQNIDADWTEQIDAVIDQTAPAFSQSIDASWFEYHEATVIQTAPSFSQSATGSLTEVGVIANIGQTAPAFTQFIDAEWTEQIDATVDQSAPLFTQSITATNSQVVDNVTGDIVQTAPSFTQRATEAISPPKIANLDQNAPLFTQSIATTTPAGTSDADLVQDAPSFSTYASVRVQKTNNLTVIQDAPGFSQALRALTTFDVVYGAINTTAPSFESSVDGTVGQKTVTGNSTGKHILRRFTSSIQASVIPDTASGTIVQNLPSFTQNVDGTSGNSVISANITSVAPGFTQSIDAEYLKNAQISQFAPTFSQLGKLSTGDVINQTAPSFYQRATLTRTPNYTEVVQPEVMVSIGRRLDDDPVPDFWDIDTALYLDKETKITMNKTTKPITMNINVVTYIDFRQTSTIDTIQKKVMNYVSN